MSMDPLTLATLTPQPLWVAWQLEDVPNRKASKIPYVPDGGKALADTPATWGSRSAAEKRAAALPKPYGLGGVGLELSSLGDGRSLGGIDLDTCRNPDAGTLESWAEDVVAVFDTYGEVSPSGTGAKLFFTYDSAALADFQVVMAGAKFGKQFTRGGGEHPPAIELHLGNRYFTVTDNILPASTPQLRHVEASRILRLIYSVHVRTRKLRTSETPLIPRATRQLIFGFSSGRSIQTDGPAFARNTAEGAKAGAGKASGSSDRSRSAAAFRVGKRAVADGGTFDAMCDALRRDPETADWMRQKGTANNFREARRIFDKAKEAGPLIRVVAGELHHAATAGEAAICTALLPIFQRGNALMRPVVQEMPATRGRMTLSAALLEITPPGLIDALCGVATWEKYDGRAEDWVRINPPATVAQTILSRAGMWTLPKIVGVITTPTIRPDGSILSAPGYDAATRLYQGSTQHSCCEPQSSGGRRSSDAQE